MTKKDIVKFLINAKVKGDFGFQAKGLKLSEKKVKVEELVLSTKLDKYDVKTDFSIPSLEFLKGIASGLIKTNAVVIVKGLEIDFENEEFEIDSIETKEVGADYDINCNITGEDTVYIQKEEVEENPPEEKSDEDELKDWKKID